MCVFFLDLGCWVLGWFWGFWCFCCFVGVFLCGVGCLFFVVCETTGFKNQEDLQEVLLCCLKFLPCFCQLSAELICWCNVIAFHGAVLKDRLILLKLGVILK